MTTETKEPEADVVADVAPEKAPPPEKAPRRQSPVFERWLIPLATPVLIVAAMVFFVLNVSRVFLAGKGTPAVVTGSVITAAILFSAAALSASRIRSSSLGLLVAGCLVVVLAAGLVTLGHAEPEKVAGGTTVEGPPIGKFAVEGANSLTFSPATADLPLDPAKPVSVIEVDLTISGGTHTFLFEDPSVVFEKLQASQGETVKGLAGFPGEGTFVFYCDVPGHRAAGMEGTVTITADVPPETVAPAAGAGGGATPSTTAA